MSFDIEKSNREIIKNRTISLNTNYSERRIFSPKCKEIIQSVEDHRMINGLTSDFAIKRGLVKTRPFVKIMPDLWKKDREEDLENRLQKMMEKLKLKKNGVEEDQLNYLNLKAS